jgi:hypothetical protein
MEQVHAYCPECKAKLSFNAQPGLCVPFKAFGQVPWNHAQIAQYNRYTEEVNRATFLPERETLLNRRHAFFVDTTELNRRQLF